MNWMEMRKCPKQKKMITTGLLYDNEGWESGHTQICRLMEDESPVGSSIQKVYKETQLLRLEDLNLDFGSFKTASLS